jgi:hypothetical protein
MLKEKILSLPLMPMPKVILLKLLALVLMLKVVVLLLLEKLSTYKDDITSLTLIKHILLVVVLPLLIRKISIPLIGLEMLGMLAI